MGMAALAGAAMVLAHWIAYVIAVPDSHSRAHVLSSTGHDHWLYLAAVALAAGVFGLGAFVRARLTDGTSNSFRYAATRLIGLQVLAFVSLEFAERILTGHEAMSLIGEPVIAIGVVAQIVVALVSAAFLCGVARVIARIRAARSVPLASSPAVGYLSSSVPAPVVALASGGLGLRGPPARVL